MTGMIVACLTSFNRRGMTLKCLEQYALSATSARLEPLAVLADDGSSDGTVEAVRAQFPWVRVVQGDGSWFWNRGMRTAMTEALKAPSVDILWLNDDTHLQVDAVQRILEVAREVRAKHGRPGIVVGATCDSGRSRLTYGGNDRCGYWKPVTFRRVHSMTEALPCETMNGNVVLIPREVADDVGPLDDVFEHAMGDLDYGLRAGRRGHPIYVVAGYIGVCDGNPFGGASHDPSDSFGQRWQRLCGRKGLPWRSWLHFTRRHAGWRAPLYFAWPYMCALMHIAQAKPTPKQVR